VISALLGAQSSNPGGGQISFSVPLPGSTAASQKLTIALPSRSVTMPQLQRAKRQFIMLQRQGRQELAPGSVAELFAKYLEDALN
jgi:tRNA uridine 5-carbamoylmethylation protein Kti12